MPAGLWYGESTAAAVRPLEGRGGGMSARDG